MQNGSDELPNFYEPKPSSTESASLSFMGKGFNYEAIHRINSDGMNQLTEIKARKDSNVFRIVTLGDSFTFGAYVNTNENYPSILQSLLNSKCDKSVKYEVLNLGVSGYDVQYSLKRLKMRGLKYKPDLIVWLVAVDQLERINRLTALKSKNILANMRSTQKGRDKLLKTPYAHIVRAKEEVVREIGEEKILHMQESYLRSVSQYYQGALLFFTFQNNRIKKSHTKLLKKIAEERQKTYFYDGIRDINMEKDGVLPDYHPSKSGYQIIAVDLYDYLVKTSLVPCESNNN